MFQPDLWPSSGRCLIKDILQKPRTNADLKKLSYKMHGLFYVLIYLHVGGGLEGPEIESRWGQDYPHPSRLALGPTQPPIQWVPGLSRG